MDPDQYIASLREPRLIVCKQCKYAVWPHAINSHFAGAGHKFSKPVRAAIVARVKEWQHLIEYSIQLEVPHFIERGFDFLHSYNDGLLCEFDKEHCHYICRSRKQMLNHLRQEHSSTPYKKKGRPTLKQQERQKDEIESWKMITCQRFFPSGIKSSYFEVRSAARQESADRVAPLWDQATIQLSQKRQAVESKMMHVIINHDSKDANPWLDRTGWCQYLEGIERDKLLESMEAPDEETEPDLQVIWEAMDEMVQLCQHTIDVRASIFIRFEIMRTEENQNRFQPLRGYMQAKEVMTRAMPWKQIVMFIGRTRKQREWKVPKYKLKSHQRKAWKDLKSVVRQHLEKVEIENEETTSDVSVEEEGEKTEEEKVKLTRLNPIAKKCMKFCLSLLYDKVIDKEYDSALICSMAVLAVTVNGWKGPDQYPQVLSAIIKIARFMVVHDAWETTQDYAKNSESSNEDSNQSISGSDEPSSKPEQQSWLQLIKGIINQYMVRGSLSPMQWALDLRAYGMKIAFNTTTKGAIDWIGDLVVYKSVQFTMDQLREMIQYSIETATHQLFRDLMFIDNEKQVPIIPWSSLRDNPSNQERQWNFIQDERNHWPVNGQSWLQNRIGANPAAKFQFVKDQSEFSWNRSGIESYMQKIIEWRGLLLVLTHMTGGQPARSPEILNVHHSNTAKGLMRNVFVEDGLIVIVSRYHKGYRISGSEKIIHRYLPRAVGQLFVYYEWLVRPFQEMIEAVVWQKETVSTLVWPPDPKGTPWTGERMTKAMRQATHRGMGVTIGIQAWRQIVINITRRFLRKDHAFQLDEDDLEGLDEDEDIIYDLQAAHTSHVAGITYGRGLLQAHGVIEKEQTRFRRASLEWHKFIGLTDEQAHIGLKRKGNEDIYSANAGRMKRLRRVHIEDRLREMLGAQARFRGCQQDAIQAIMRGDNFIVMVMGTGSGKSLAFMMPAWSSRGGFSVVVVPLVALLQDMIDRCQRLKISCAEWKGHQQAPAVGIRILFVTPESAVSEEFHTWLNRQKSAGQLDRIFIDECHVILNDQADFRPKLEQMGILNQVGVQMILMTATLPPSMEEELWKRMWWNDAKVRLFRDRTSRPNIRYSTMYVQGLGSKYEQRVHAIHHATGRHVGGKAVIYCRSVATTRKLAEMLGCDGFYHDAPNKIQMLRRFREEAPVIVATNAFGMGIDVSNIRIVLHVDPPRNMLDYAQESGRAGRDGLPSEAIVIMSATKEIGSEPREEADPQAMLITLFVENRACKRQILDEFLDGHHRTQCEAGETMCGFCESNSGPDHIQGDDASDSNKSDNQHSSPSISPLLQERQQERQQIIDRHRLQMQQEGREEKELWEYLDQSRGFCPVCRWIHDTHEEHVLYHCPRAEAVPYKKRYKQLQGLIRNSRMMEKFTGCMFCYAPQAWCQGWVEKEAGGGSQKRGSWQRLGGGRGLCQFDEVLLSEYVVAMGQKEFEEIIANRNKRMQEKKLDPENEIHEGRFLGRKVVWAGLETNGLVLELNELTKYWD